MIDQEKFEAIISRYQGAAEDLIPVLHDLQDDFSRGHISRGFERSAILDDHATQLALHSDHKKGSTTFGFNFTPKPGWLEMGM